MGALSHPEGLQNWFRLNHTDEQFSRHLLSFVGQPKLRFLQIGVYAGDATMWLFRHVLTHPTSILYDVDPWIVDPDDEWDDMVPGQRLGAEELYDRRTSLLRAKGRIRKVALTSGEFFAQWTDADFDFAYVDGNHAARNALEDGIDAFRRLKLGGLLAFDDYGWRHPVRPGTLAEPTVAIDAFLTVYADHIRPLEPAGTCGQAWVQRCR